MKKINKTYHLQEFNNSKISASPGRITKNSNRTVKQKISQKTNGSVAQSRKEQFKQINKRVQQRLQVKIQQNRTQRSYEQHSQYHYLNRQKDSSSVNYSQGTIKESVNPYEEIYQNDLKYFEQYLNSTAKYQHNGINLNWPFYFSKPSPQNR